MNNAIPFSAQIEAVRSKLPADASEDFRIFAEGLVNWIGSINPNVPQAGGVAANSQATPAGCGIVATGANGAFTLAITNGKNTRPVWHRVSYSTLKNFSANVTVMPVTTATSLTLNLPGQSCFFQLESSFDQVNWSAAVLAASAAVNSGLVSSAATAEGASFNQTNFGVVSSAAAGASANVLVNGANGPFTSLPRQKGATQTLLPSATIAGVTPGTDKFVAWDGQHYVVRSTLAAVLADDLAPIGKVSVVSTAVPRLPVITPVIVGGYIVGYNVEDGGAGASQPYDLTLIDVGDGSGATFGAQTIQNGVLLAVAQGNPGNGSYSGGTEVQVSGGSGGGTPGGGTALGGNGGRLTAV